MFLRRLQEFRANNTDDNTILNFFDEQEIHAFSVNAEEIETSILAHMIEHIGTPRNYGPSKEEIRRQQKALEEQKVNTVFNLQYFELILFSYENLNWQPHKRKKPKSKKKKNTKRLCKTG